MRPSASWHSGAKAGDCAFCDRSIARSCHVTDADGRGFIVGTDCVRHTCEGDEVSGDMERELKHQKEQEATARYEARHEACWTALRADPGFLADKPHPASRRTDKSLRDEVLRLFRGTQATRSKAFGIVETALAERAGIAAHRRRFQLCTDPSRPGRHSAHLSGRPTGGTHSPRRRAVQA